MTQLDGVSLRQPTAAESFAYISERMLIGAQIIFDATKNESFAVTHLCGHSVETALKAILAKSGASESELRLNFGHDLEKLWVACAQQTDLIAASTPVWLEHLNRLHNKPYTVRYPMGLNGVTFPNQEFMYTQLLELNRIMSAYVLGA